MQKPHGFRVVPLLPDKIKTLNEFIYNLYWTWDHEALDLFSRIDHDLWNEVNHNPVLLLSKINQKRLEELSEDEGFTSHLERILANFNWYCREKTWFGKLYGEKYPNLVIAYFSAEFGITESIPIYSGGLGILAGDHLKSASDLGVPIVGIGLLYQQGYFRQYLNIDGWQQETFLKNDFYNMCIQLVKTPDNQPVMISVDYPGRQVKAKIWKVEIGRVSLYLLDTNVFENSLEDQKITDQLYGGDLEMRIKQEIMLGIGGIHALKALRIEPTIFHLNEGHSAFLSLERIKRFIQEKNLSFDDAYKACKASGIFTTHTPVPAGIDIFPPYLIDRYFYPFYQTLNIDRDTFFSLGRINANDKNAPFNMATLAIKTTVFRNGVSKLHGMVSRKMWKDLWPLLLDEEIPIKSITNGIHVRSWISHEMEGLLTRYLGPSWIQDPADQSIWEKIAKIPSSEIWWTHQRRRENLVTFIRDRLVKQIKDRGGSAGEISHAEQVLHPEALTIGFARRFVTYKRAGLIFSDPDRLAEILNNKERPVQIIIAGKAHPQDNEGKEIIKKIIHFCRQERFRLKVVFVEDYDIAVSRKMVQGVDIWLNTPRRLLEGCGTSGMKVNFNGGLNLSIIDGWWYEAYDSDTGWAIGKGEEYTDKDYQDRIESNTIYDLLEKEVAPLFYNRDKDQIPYNWISLIKSSLKKLNPVFNTNRMVCEYLEKFYLPAAQRYTKIINNDMQGVKELAVWKRYIMENWSGVKIEKVESKTLRPMPAGSNLEVSITINLNKLTPKDVKVQIYYGIMDTEGEIENGEIIDIETFKHEDGKHIYMGQIPCSKSGRNGYLVRIVPYHENMINPLDMGLIIWM
ncbi:MAG: alpha-glucan family phosphorylase [Candidatus Firestonebacteria bacterium]|nr:alpha-glucan family phosphorylase [Candidatus Firestonebacteria bacterium]